MQRVKPLDSISALDPKVQSAIREIPISDRYFVALSGGMDSVALLYFCLPFLKLHTTTIEVIHIHHGLSANAQAWAEFCSSFCAQLGLICHVEYVEVVSQGRGVEAAARVARYDVFKRHLSKGGVLLQGHHLNDQAETVLMRLFKGLGPASLKGMPITRPLASGIIYRPWLRLTRAALKKEADRYGLTWVEDESNDDVRFERNFIRKDVLPLLESRRPSILSDLNHAASKAKDTHEFITEWCENNKHSFLSQKYKREMALDLKGLSVFSDLQRQFIVRYWLDLLGVAHPSDKSFQRVFDEMLGKNSDAQPEVVWKENVLQVFDGALFCIKKFLKDSVFCSVELAVQDIRNSTNQTCLVDLSFGTLIVELMDSKQQLQYEGEADYVVYCRAPESLESLSVVTRKGGEKIYLQSKHSSSIKKLYQQEKILPWYRDKIPLIFSGDELVCSLAGHVSHSYKCDGLPENLKEDVLVFSFNLAENS